MDDSSQIAQNIEGDDQQENDPNEMNINQELVDSVEERMEQAMPTIQQMAQFEESLQKAPDLAKQIAAICPELIMAFVQRAQAMQQDQTVQKGMNGQPNVMPQSGPVPSGGNMGATAPNLQGPQAPSGPDENEESGAMVMPGSSANGPMPPPGATSRGAPPPSVPGASSPLRKQYYTGR